MKVLTSLAVWKLGKENDIDLGAILSTGPGGRVMKAGVLKIINAKYDAMGSSAVNTPSTLA